MVEITPKADSVMQITSPTGKFTLKGFNDYTLTTERTDSIVSWQNEEVVFAGFGVVAPEWDGWVCRSISAAVLPESAP